MTRDDELWGDDGRVRSRLVGTLELAGQQLRHAKGRSGLAVFGIAIAVVLVTVMTGLGYGMTKAGTEALTYIEQDLWVTAGPLQLAPGSVGGVRNTLLNAHDTQRAIEARPDVASAEAIGFQAVFIGSTRDELTTVVGVGVTGDGTDIGLREEFTRDDIHYANGTYDGPMTHSVIVSRGTADQLDVSTGDTVYIGGTRETARQQPFTVVGVSGRFETFLGAPTAVVHLGELQTLTGRTGSDRAAVIGIRVREEANASVAADIERTHPTLQVRTQHQQFRAVFEDQAAMLASAITLVVLAIIVGIALVANTLGLVVYQQRRELAALRATGMRTRTLVGVVGAQGVLLSVLGAAVGLAVTPVIAVLINRAVTEIVGFSGLIKLPVWVIGVGSVVALAIGLVGASVAGIRLVRMNPEVHLDR
jgi:putative ABC transport system permease protein